MGLDLEEELIGNLLLNSEFMNYLSIDEKYFFNPFNKKIIPILKKQFLEIHDVNLTLMQKYFANNDEYKKSISILTEYLSNTLPTTKENIIKYQEQIYRNYIKIEIDKLILSYNQSRISQEELVEQINKLNNSFLRVEHDKLSGEEIYDLITSKNKVLNFKIDALTKYGNIQEHDFVIVAARTGVGKSGFMLNLLDDLSKSYTCLFFNMEMTEKQVFSRLVSINSYVPMEDFMTTDLYQKEKMTRACAEIASRNIKVFTGIQNIQSIKNKIMKESSNNKHILVFVDYVGLIYSDFRESEYERLTKITKELRRISLDNNCTIFAAAQINRAGAEEPTIADLKGSGELEQSATAVILLHEKEKIDDDLSIVVASLGKNRNGRKCKMLLNYYKKTQVFSKREL